MTARGQEEGKMKRCSMGIKFQLCRINSRDLMYNTRPRVNNTVLYTQTFVRRVDPMLSVLIKKLTRLTITQRGTRKLLQGTEKLKTELDQQGWRNVMIIVSQRWNILESKLSTLTPLHIRLAQRAISLQGTKREKFSHTIIRGNAWGCLLLCVF